jgi:hypothetical protein
MTPGRTTGPRSLYRTVRPASGLSGAVKDALGGLGAIAELAGGGGAGSRAGTPDATSRLARFTLSIAPR